MICSAWVRWGTTAYIIIYLMIPGCHDQARAQAVDEWSSARSGLPSLFLQAHLGICDDRVARAAGACLATGFLRVAGNIYMYNTHMHMITTMLVAEGHTPVSMRLYVYRIRMYLASIGGIQIRAPQSR